MDTSQLDRPILHTLWIALGVGLAFEAITVFTTAAPFSFFIKLALVNTAAFLPATLWVHFYPRGRFNRYVVSIAFLLGVAATNYVMDELTAFYLVLIVQAVVTLYQDRLLLMITTGLGMALYAIVLAFQPNYLSQLRLLNPSLTEGLVGIFGAFAVGAVIFDLLGRRLTRQGQQAYLADYDPLTGLFNRRRFEAELSQELTRSSREPHSGALLFLDLDLFKEVNDTLGHAAGDQLLQTWASLLHQTLRTTDVISRLGGDEFAIILPGASREQAIAVGERILSLAEQTDGPRIKGRHVGASIGVALYPDHGSTVSELVSCADRAMYQAKRTGRNQCSLFAGTENIA